MQRRSFPSIRASCCAVALALPLLAGAQAAFTARTQEANLLSVLDLDLVQAADAPRSPRSPMLLSSDGNLYLTTFAGGALQAGSVIRIDPNDQVSTVVSFTGPPAQGSGPFAGVIQADDGNLYGTTYLGGANQAGTVYRVTPTGTYTLLHSFNAAQQGGFLPYAGLVQAPDGNLYGTTLRGGPADAGTLFRISLSGTLTNVLDFAGANIRAPQGAMAVGPDGNLYGTTLQGGAGDRGTVYRLETASGRLTTLFSFAGLNAFNNDGQAINATGANPRGGLTLAPDGSFYGLTHSGGTGGFGNLYRVTTAGVQTVVHAFAGGPADGGAPLGEVSIGPDGTLYGTTQLGGFANAGTAWQLRPGATLEILHSFSNRDIDGGQPFAGLTPRGGFLYGSSFTNAWERGASLGALFKLERAVGGVLPVELEINPARIAEGATSTLSWSAPAQATCTLTSNRGGGFFETVTQVSTAGTRQVPVSSVQPQLAREPAGPGIRNYLLACVDGTGVERIATAYLVVSAPSAQPIDGGGSGGGGAFSPWALALLGLSLLGRRLAVRPFRT